MTCRKFDPKDLVNTCTEIYLHDCPDETNKDCPGYKAIKSNDRVMYTLDGSQVRFDDEMCFYGVFKNDKFTGEVFSLFGLAPIEADKLTLNACRMWYQFLESGKWALHVSSGYTAKQRSVATKKYFDELYPD